MVRIDNQSLFNTQVPSREMPDFIGSARTDFAGVYSYTAMPPPSSMATRSSCRPIATPIAGLLVGPASPRSSAARERAWQSGSQLACRRHRRSPAGTTRQSGRLLLGRPGWRGKTDSHAAGDRLAPRRATGGDVNDPNWTCCSISVADSKADRRAAGRAEVVVQLASLRTVPGIASVLTLKTNLRLREIGVAG